MTDEKQTISTVITQMLQSTGCSICRNHHTHEYCQYCTPIQHDNLWNIDPEYADTIADEILRHLGMI